MRWAIDGQSVPATTLVMRDPVLPGVVEDRGIAELVDVPVGGAAHGWDQRRVGAFPRMLGPQHFRLGCTPIVNLFAQTSEPIVIDRRHYEYRLVADQKREAMVAHASQIPADSFFLAMPIEAFRQAFGQEWFIRRDAPDIREKWLFDDL